MIKAMIFDLDNTLVDFIKMKTISCEAAVAAMIDAGLKMNKKKAIKRIFDIYMEIGMESKDIFQKFLKESNGGIDYRILGAGIAAYRRVHTSFYEPYPHVFSTLIALREKGVTLAILSDAPRLKAWIRLCSIRLDNFFDIVVTVDDTKALKPAKKAFDLVLKKLKMKPEECLMVGDTLDRDIVGGSRVGMQTCLAKYGATKFTKPKSKVKPDFVIRDIQELIKIVS